MKLDHPKLIKSLRLAYSAERAASFAYIGHAGSLSDPTEKAKVSEIEQDEWEHRAHVLKIMKQYGVSISIYYEIKYWWIGRLIGSSCYLIGRFMPYFFAGKLESGNVCEYFRMMHCFHSLGIEEHDEVLYEMGIKEKAHEVYFLEMIKDACWLPLFEKLFSWGVNESLNDVDLENAKSLEESKVYCSKFNG